jgi:hypothetical protein
MVAGFQAVISAASMPNRSLLCVADLVDHGGMMRGSGGSKLGGIGPGDEVSYRMRFCESIVNGGHHRCTTTVGPHSQLLSIQPSANILCDRMVLLKLEKLSLLMFIG